MSFPEDPDKPAFDIVQFEADAQARAAEFVAQVSRLAVITTAENPDEWVQTRGAQYQLADDTRLEVLHTMTDEPDDPERVIAKALITQPSVESLGLDHKLRRVTLSRLVVHSWFADTDDMDADTPNTGTEDDPDLHDDALVESAGPAFEALQEQRLRYQMHPQYRPLELIQAATIAQVECKLPGDKPNFRTERYSNNMPAETKAAHMEARREAGESQEEEDPDYSVSEHKALMALLASIDPELAEAQPPGEEIAELDITKWDLSTTARSWRPRD